MTYYLSMGMSVHCFDCGLNLDEPLDIDVELELDLNDLIDYEVYKRLGKEFRPTAYWLDDDVMKVVNETRTAYESGALDWSVVLSDQECLDEVLKRTRIDEILDTMSEIGEQTIREYTMNSYPREVHYTVQNDEMDIVGEYVCEMGD